jgi:transcription elongation factor Elf1
MDIGFFTIDNGEPRPIYHGKFRLLEMKVQKEKNGKCWLNKYQCPYCNNSFLSTKTNSKKRSSCGCTYIGHNGNMIKRHGLSYSLIYRKWKSMLDRTNMKSKNDHYKKSYRDKNIGVCDEWRNFGVFYKWSMENGYNDNFQIDRIRNSEGYSPENCHWVLPKENVRNRDSTILNVESVKEIRKLLKQGCRMCDLARRYSVTTSAIYSIKKYVTWKEIV